MKTLAFLAVSAAGLSTSLFTSFVPADAPEPTGPQPVMAVQAEPATPVLGIAGSFEAEKRAAPMTESVDQF